MHEFDLKDCHWVWLPISVPGASRKIEWHADVLPWLKANLSAIPDIDMRMYDRTLPPKAGQLNFWQKVAFFATEEDMVAFKLKYGGA
jgi:hypothetical protein